MCILQTRKLISCKYREISRFDIRYKETLGIEYKILENVLANGAILLSYNHKILLYKQILKPIWIHGIH